MGDTSFLGGARHPSVSMKAEERRRGKLRIARDGEGRRSAGRQEMKKGLFSEAMDIAVREMSKIGKPSENAVDDFHAHK